MIKATKRYGSANPSRHMASGFTLVELLIVMSILGVLMTAVFALYNTQHRMTYIEEDVVEVQQNLRMGMDSLLRDLRYGGILVTGSTAPVSAIGNNTGLGATDIITLNTSSSTNTFARVNLDLTTNVIAGVDIVLTVASAEEVDAFSAGDTFRVVNSSEKAEPISTYFTVSSTDRTGPTITAAPAATATNVLFRRGYMLAKTGTAGPDTFPNTIQYCVGPNAGCGSAITTCTVGNCLIRIENGTADDADVVAEGISDLQFLYILDASTAEVDTTGTPANVRAVRINLTGVTVETAALSTTAKTRSLTAVAKLRNR
ncbi:MAG: prepilin-type N-terminal cleavage/methylation domain-containing protein [Proteobacteria bacterium]|nr:prepilin-type N-terminal cleavage/methylation domain-containing protein [Pseudomonadota bacterium]